MNEDTLPLTDKTRSDDEDEDVTEDYDSEEENVGYEEIKRAMKLDTEYEVNESMSKDDMMNMIKSMKEHMKVLITVTEVYQVKMKLMKMTRKARK